MAFRCLPHESRKQLQWQVVWLPDVVDAPRRQPEPRGGLGQEGGRPGLGARGQRHRCSLT
eukprot:15186345-Heterocapsa_arctica.AAC.1